MTDSKRISPNDGRHYFFGYYDLQPYNKDSSLHLAHSPAFIDRMPELGETCDIGYICLAEDKFYKVAETRAWNFQQGSLLQWFDDESIIYNDYIDGKYVSVIKKLNGDTVKIIDKPLGHISQDRKWGLAINFDRIYNFRPGYGYCMQVDPFYNENAPKDDGIFLVNIETGESKLIISYDDMKKTFPEEPFCDMKLVVNHITFNPSADHFLFLLRNFPEPGKKWGTLMVVSDLEGNMVNLTNYEVNSHYHWYDDDFIMIYSGLPRWGIYYFDLKRGIRSEMNNPLMDADDIHCLFSPDRRYIIGDGYPDENNHRHLYVYDTQTKQSEQLLEEFSLPAEPGDIRCDLHNIWNPDGTRISYDSTRNSVREIREYDFAAYLRSKGI